MLLFEKINQKLKDFIEKKGFYLPIINNIIDHIEKTRKLRPPQIQAIKIYLFLRYEVKAQNFIELIKYCYQDDMENLIRFLEIKHVKDITSKFNKFTEITPQIIKQIDFEQDIKPMLEIIKNEVTPEEFKKLGNKKKYQTLHEALNLNYPSYIFALVMGSGKTYLIASIIAVEFAISIDNDTDNTDENTIDNTNKNKIDDTNSTKKITLIQNALIFAPTRTIKEQLKKIIDMDYSWVLPENLLNSFQANIKYFTENDVAMMQGDKGKYNIIITNTEKLTYNKKITSAENLKIDRWECNKRVNNIKRLKNLAIFSDEAHHTYGNTKEDTGKKIKKVREMINEIANQSNLRVVVNTTGTPYTKKDMLKEVVTWYGLQQAIEDKILKSLENGIKTYDFKEKDNKDIVKDIIEDFFDTYKNTTLDNGAKAKIAFYFLDEKQLQKQKDIIIETLNNIDENQEQIIIYTQKSKKEQEIEFKNINNPDSNKRVLLLIQKGMEGWDCPSLFATAIIRKESKSDNYILQAATRCLRNNEAKDIKAKIYLDKNNETELNKQLKSNFDTDLKQLNKQKAKKTITKILKVNKKKLTHIQQNPIVLKSKIKSLKITPINLNEIEFEKINEIDIKKFIITETKSLDTKKAVIDTYGQIEKKEKKNNYNSLIEITYHIARKYHLTYLKLYDKLYDFFTKTQKIHDINNIDLTYRTKLEEQIEKKLEKLIIKIEAEEEKKQIKYILKKEGFIEKENEETKELELFTTIDLSEDKEKLLLTNTERHYSPYNFDSEPEKIFLETMLTQLEDKIKKNEIEDIYFTGGLTHPKQTDIHFTYQDEKGQIREYYPDFLIRKTNGDYIIVEIKGKIFEKNTSTDNKAKAVKQFVNQNGNQMISYELIIVEDKDIPSDEIDKITKKLENKSNDNLSK